MKRTFKFALCAIMALSLALTQVACDKQTVVTLKQIGEKVGPLTDVAQTEFNNLAQAGVINKDVVDKLNKADVFNKTKLVGKFIGDLGDVTASNKQEVIDKIKEGVDLLNGNILALQPGSKIAKILTGISITLDSARVAVILINPPPAPENKSFALSAEKEPGVSTATISVKIKVDKTVADELKKLK